LGTVGIGAYLGFCELEVLEQNSGEVDHDGAGHGRVHRTQETRRVRQRVVVTRNHHPTRANWNKLFSVVLIRIRMRIPAFLHYPDPNNWFVSGPGAEKIQIQILCRKT